MEKHKILDTLQRISVFLVGISFFMVACRQCIIRYFEFQTARSFEVIKSKDFYLPEITVCLDTTMNVDMLKRYGYESSLSYILGPWQGIQCVSKKGDFFFPFSA